MAESVSTDGTDNVTDTNDMVKTITIEESVEGESVEYDYKKMIKRENRNNLTLMRRVIGADLTRRYNLILLEQEKLMMIAGRYVLIFDVKTRKIEWLQALGDNTVNSITVQTSGTYFALGEKGESPKVLIFQTSDYKLVNILREGTKYGYADLAFNKDGKLIATLGMQPDYMLTIWSWNTESILMRTKAFSQEVFKITFSEDLEGYLCSSGQGHIKFWKMETTFTGLKLKGELGRFGQTELSDIEAFFQLPDGKVVSGCEWGNLLVWDTGIIKLEACGPNGKPCHAATISQIMAEEGDLYTVGQDGYIRAWDFETIDIAEAREFGNKLELQPVSECCVSKGARLKSAVKKPTSSDMDTDTIWFVQDTLGCIWKVSLGYGRDTKKPVVVYRCFNGPIQYMAASLSVPLTTVISNDATLQLLDYEKGTIKMRAEFCTKPTCSDWYRQTGNYDPLTLFIGFESGVVRAISLIEKDEDKMLMETKKNKYLIQDDPDTYIEELGYSYILLDAKKPHNKPVIDLRISFSSIVATISYDSTIFFLRYRFIHKDLEPIGYTNLNSVPRGLRWSFKTPSGAALLFVWCEDETIYMYRDSELIKPILVDQSYEIAEFPKIMTRLTSIKSRIRHDEEIERETRIEEAKAAKKKRAAEEEADMDDEKHDDEPQQTPQPTPQPTKVEETDADQDGDENKSDVEEWKPEIPAVRSRIQFVEPLYNEEKQVLVSLDGYDKGYLYVCDLLAKEEFEKRVIIEKSTTDSIEPVEWICLDNLNDSTLTTCQLGPNAESIIFGTDDGKIRIYSIKKSLCDIFPSGVQASKNFNLPICAWRQLGNRKLDFEVFDEYEVARKSGDIKSFSWQICLHDYGSGRIGFISLNQLGTTILTAGVDSVIYNCHLSASEEPLVWDKIEYPESKQSLVADITDPTTFSLEETMLRQEEEKRKAAAEDAQKDMREKINVLRSNYEHLLKDNKNLPDSVQLNGKEFFVAEEIRLNLLNSLSQKKIDTELKLAYNREVAEKARFQVETFYKTEIENESIRLFSFRSSAIYVSSFTLIRLPQQMEDDLHSLTEELIEEDHTVSQVNKVQTQKLTEEEEEQQQEEEEENNRQVVAEQKLFKVIRTAHQERVERELKRINERRRQRIERKKEWDDLLKRKIDDDWVNEELHREIEWFSHNVGDYALKTSENFKVDDATRMTETKAIRKLIELKKIIYKTKKDFNEMFFNLRDEKLELVTQITFYYAMIYFINQRLDKDFVLDFDMIPTFNFDELADRWSILCTTDTIQDYLKNRPTKEIVVLEQMENLSTDDDSGNEEPPKEEAHPNEFDVKKLNMALIESEAKMEVPKTTFQSFLGLRINVNAVNVEKEFLIYVRKFIELINKLGISLPKYELLTNNIELLSIDLPKTKNLEKLAKSFPSISTEMSRIQAMETDQMSHVRLSALKREKIVLEGERKKLLEYVNLVQRVFDIKLSMLRHRYNTTLKYLKNCDLRQTTLYKELVILRNFQQKERELRQSMQQSKKEQTKVSKQLEVTEQKFIAITKNLERIENNLKTLKTQSVEIAAKGEKFENYLLKVYKKKLTRKKSKDDDENTSSESSDLSDFDSDSDFTESLDDDDESGPKEYYDIEQCPNSCSEEIYDEIVELRSKRWSQENQLNEEKKRHDIYKKENEMIQKNYNQIKNNLSTIQTDIEIFERKKQQMLNEIEVIITLKIHQIEFLRDDIFPNDLSEALVFDLSRMRQLSGRITELRKMKTDEQQKLKHLKKKRHEMDFEIERRTQIVKDFAKKIRQMMINKFGNIVNMEKIDSLAVNAQQERLREKLATAQANNYRQVSRIQKEIDRERGDFIEQLKDNTNRNTELIDMAETQFNIETDLNKRQLKIGEEFGITTEMNNKSTEKILKTLKLQDEEIFNLRTEISSLKNKTSRIMMPLRTQLQLASERQGMSSGKSRITTTDHLNIVEREDTFASDIKKR
ncbi:hypothetical protein SNEBB_009742 [Seison nebaliae]|nr:hypothetical protein SNEBB_009742 [Seison nebaliae]